MTIGNANRSCGTAVKPSCKIWRRETPKTPLLKSACVACSACPVTNATSFYSHSILSWILMILKAVTLENSILD